MATFIPLHKVSSKVNLSAKKETFIFAKINGRVTERFGVEFLEEVFAFLDELDEKARNKVLFNIDRAKAKKDSTLFKKLNADIWEFRTLYNKRQYRLFAFWDKTKERPTVVVATHGIVKKTQKTPSKEINKAMEMMKNYFKNKKK